MMMSMYSTFPAGSIAEAIRVAWLPCEHRLANAAGRLDSVTALAAGCAR